MTDDELQRSTIVEILPTKVWIEDDFCGGRHVMRQHQGCEPFCYASFWYDYAHTDNATTYGMATDLAMRLGAVEPIERTMRSLPEPTPEEDRWLALIGEHAQDAAMWEARARELGWRDESSNARLSGAPR